MIRFKTRGMSGLAVLIWGGFFCPSSFGVGPLVKPVPLSSVDCEEVQKIAEEYLDLELAGARWQGGDSPCLPRVPLRRLKVRKIEGISDPALLDPEFLIPSNRKVEIQAKRIPNDLIEVKFNYIGTDMGKDVAIRDGLLLKLNFNQALKEKGCASLYKPPAHFVMRSACKVD